VGTTSVTENIEVLAWGAQMNYDGGVPPYTLYSEVYRHRLWYGGDPAHPDYIWFSESESPELVDSLSFFRTTSGEAVTGMKRLGESLVIFTINTIDVITGYREEDFFIRPFSPSVGCISHHAIQNIHDRLWFPSQTGVYVYDGSLKYVIDDMRDYWKSEYEAFPTEFENSIAVDDPDEYSYHFIPQYSDKTHNLVAFYLPFEPSVGGGGQQPWWSFDHMGRRMTAVGKLTTGTNRFSLYNGSTDGYLRKMNVDADINDDSDSYAKRATITTKLYMMDDPGGDAESGKELLTLWCYVESEAQPWIVEIRAGDESAGDILVPYFTKTVAASAQVDGTTTWVAKTTHSIQPGRVVGRGFMFTFTVASPTGFRWRGLGGTWTLGPTSRGKRTA
jgi:hypothetical protein